MSKENQNKRYDGQNRCRRCDRPLSDPNDVYGWRCTQIVGFDKYNELASMLDDDTLKGYTAYITKYLSDDSKGVDESFTALTYNYNVEPKANPSEILNMGYDSAGEWHDWDAERYGVDSPVYKMLSGLNTAYERRRR